MAQSKNDANSQAGSKSSPRAQEGAGKQSEGVQGEGDYKSAKAYGESVKRFVQSGKVDEAARAAAPKNDREAREMKEAESTGKRRAKDEDPAVSQIHDKAKAEKGTSPKK